jgi:very-short-patch-repair endonuclease
VKLDPNIQALVDRASSAVGNRASEFFALGTIEYCFARIQSPIEQAFYVAFEALHEICLPKAEFIEYDGKPFLLGLTIEPQFEIGKYRVDFLVCYQTTPLDPLKKVVVECDSQAFHERDERERRYEKARDRFIQSNGYTVFHYTGSELWKNPFIAASEVIGHLTNRDPKELIEEFEQLVAI